MCAWDTETVPVQMHLSLLHHGLLLASEASGTDLLFLSSKRESVLPGWTIPIRSWGCGESWDTKLGMTKVLLVQSGSLKPSSLIPSANTFVGNCKCFFWGKKDYDSHQFQVNPNLLLVIKPMKKASIFQLSHNQHQMGLRSGKCMFLVKATAYPLVVVRDLLGYGTCIYKWFAKFGRYILQFT